MILADKFVDKYRQVPVKWGWQGIGAVAFYRTYSRDDNPKARRNKESWTEVCRRCVEFMFTAIEVHCATIGTYWNKEKAQENAQEAFDLMFYMKWSPPGRGLWQAGTEFVDKRGTVEGLNNCAFISSSFLLQERGSFFGWLMNMSMLGIGIGFDTRGAGLLTIKKPEQNASLFITIPDSREGWSESVEELINSYLDGSPKLLFDYSIIREKGTPIKGFGGVASGPEPLMKLHTFIRAILDANLGKPLSSRLIVDLCNRIGVCVVAGNVRRSALIALGDINDKEFLDLKDYNKYPERKEYGWTSNNSPLVTVGSDYTEIANRAWKNGEPGIVWEDNIRDYGRMNGIYDFHDSKAMGVNPCAEQVLNHRELCNIPETFPPNCKSMSEWLRALKYAYMYGKSVALLNKGITDAQSRQAMCENMRLGISFSGVTMLQGMWGQNRTEEWMARGYAKLAFWDRLYSQWMQVPESIRLTSQKPSGTLSLLAGIPPGVHYFPAGRFHVRRMVIADSSEGLLSSLTAAGYPIEPSVYSSDCQVVSFPVDAGPYCLSEREVSPARQLANAARVQEYWSDNSVSVTVKFDHDDLSPSGMIALIKEYETKLKTVSFMPFANHGYVQAPYEEISRKQYHRMWESIGALEITDAELEPDLYCEGDRCIVT